ncbi:MAG: hypothetical protein VKO26_06115 [Cyanobacteriota bacterium]|nr:hypothetical protein [Cyanobacteriota bacterium]
MRILPKPLTINGRRYKPTCSGAPGTRSSTYSLVFGPKAQDTPDSAVVAKLAAHFPRDRFAQFTTIHDATQTAFYAQMGPAGQACNAWTNKMLRELASRQAATNVHAYVAQGDTHTILRAPLFDTEASGGVGCADWLRALLEDSQPPANARCPRCEGPRVGCAP